MSRTRVNLLLLLVAAIWGTTFVAQHLAQAHLGPFFYSGARFLLGALVISPLAWREHRRRAPGVGLDRRDVLACAALGLLLCGGIGLQQMGLASTTVTNAGFLTALYMPLVPLLAWALHRHPPGWWTAMAVLGSLCGTWLLSGGAWSALTEGDLWILASTLFWAFHTLYVGRVAGRKGLAVTVAWLQFVVCGGLALAWGLAQEAVSVPALWAALPAIAYGGVLSVGVGFTLQVVAQRHSRPADAAVLLSAETLFAGVAGAVWLGERLQPWQLLGCALIFGSIVAVQLLPMRRGATAA